MLGVPAFVFVSNLVDLRGQRLAQDLADYLAKVRASSWKSWPSQDACACSVLMPESQLMGHLVQELRALVWSFQESAADAVFSTAV